MSRTFHEFVFEFIRCEIFNHGHDWQVDRYDCEQPGFRHCIRCGRKEELKPKDHFFSSILSIEGCDYYKTCKDCGKKEKTGKQSHEWEFYEWVDKERCIHIVKCKRCGLKEEHTHDIETGGTLVVSWCSLCGKGPFKFIDNEKFEIWTEEETWTLAGEQAVSQGGQEFLIQYWVSSYGREETKYVP